LAYNPLIPAPPESKINDNFKQAHDTISRIKGILNSPGSNQRLQFNGSRKNFEKSYRSIQEKTSETGMNPQVFSYKNAFHNSSTQEGQSDNSKMTHERFCSNDYNTCAKITNNKRVLRQSLLLQDFNNFSKKSLGQKASHKTPIKPTNVQFPLRDRLGPTDVKKSCFSPEQQNHKTTNIDFGRMLTKNGPGQMSERI
jgi:hypothetical protein